jgi:hypothetical protein
METMGDFAVIRVPDRAPNDGDLLRPDHVTAVEGLLAGGSRKIAIFFEETSSLPRSRQISILVRCIKIAKEKGAQLSIIAPDASLRSLFSELGFAEMITIYSSEEDMLRYASH